MRIVRYQQKDEAPQYGWLLDDKIGEIDGDIFGRYRRRDASLPRAEAKLLAPSQPSKIVCVGRNYVDHAKELGNEVPKVPLLFLKPPSSIISSGEAIVLPPQSAQVEHEAELVAVVGKRGRHITTEDAKNYILGYTVGNEGSVREYQRHTTQWGMGKNFDRTGSVGPWMVTADELPKGGKGLKIETRLNGKVMQSSNTDLLMFPVAESLVYLTEGMTLEPGDILFTGTPSGVGHARKPEPVWMKAGDVAEVEVEGIGTLRNPIEDEKA
jgi:2-keto-4-pentenoate hydratase/2-oxohepta-3-ene-1,7-dioic acid hydratase in catechol pathway